MTNLRRTLPAIVVVAILVLAPVSDVLAQTATVTLTSQKQYIRGFGGMVHIPWAGDLNAAERTLAFGNGDGQLGFTVLRIPVPDSNTSDTSYVTTAKAAIAGGGIVYATPWNGKSVMNTADFATYANHLSGFVSTMKNAGAELYSVSVQNEPDYANEWRSWTPEQCHDFVLNYGDKVGTKLMGCESFNYSKKFYDPILNDSAALAKLGVLGTHLYGTAVSAFPYPLFDQKAEGKVERWMTEHYTDSNTDANSWPNALNVATELHNSMVKAQFNVYTWWYIKRSYGPINNGAVTKRGWCMAHWSKFIRPGFYRVDATDAPTSGVNLSAYKSDKSVVIVIVNTNSASKSLTITVDGSSIASFDKYTTSSSKSLASDGKVTASGGSLSVTLDASSVTTLVGGGSDIPISGAGGGSGSGSGGSTGGGGSTGAGTGGSAGRPDAGLGRDSAVPVGTDGAVVGTGGKTTDPTPGTGGATGTGGARTGTGGALGTGGSGPGSQVGSGGSQSATGGAPGSGGATHTSTTTTVDGTDNGCQCHVGRQAVGPKPLILFLALPLLAWVRRRRRS
jgi:glucuronoarabinoxylan endo-1,4-beta-xylanase